MQSYAAMNVHVGHFSDPENIPGIAHFCEHMLFLGSSKYCNSIMIEIHTTVDQRPTLISGSILLGQPLEELFDDVFAKEGLA